MTHPAFTTSFENREMFGWPTANTFMLLLDDCQKFAFTPSGSTVQVVRYARNGYRNGQYQVTGRFSWSLRQARQEWARLISNGAVRI